jgi:hypothetical protein
MGWSLAATGAALAIAAVASVILLSSTPQAAAGSPARPAPARAVRSPSATTISVHRTALGRILVGPHGDTLYAFLPGPPRSRCVRVGQRLPERVADPGRSRVGPGRRRRHVLAAGHDHGALGTDVVV